MIMLIYDLIILCIDAVSKYLYVRCMYFSIHSVTESFLGNFHQILQCGRQLEHLDDILDVFPSSILSNYREKVINARDHL